MMTRFLNWLTNRPPLFVMKYGSESMLRVRPNVKLPPAAKSTAEFLGEWRSGVKRNEARRIDERNQQEQTA